MKRIELTQNQVALVDDVDYEYLMKWKWYADWHRKHFRAKRALLEVGGKQKIICMHTVIAERMGIGAKYIDHRDQNPLNNQRSNLRGATNSQNLHNRGAQKNSKTGVKGVSLCASTGRYRGQIVVEGRFYNLGRFDTIAEAAAAVQRRREELVGEFACH